ncbi:hypothetical protein KIW84_042507, partial [Lathyrus oleraceus]
SSLSLSLSLYITNSLSIPTNGFTINMSYYDHQQQPPVGVPPPQGYPQKDAYPPPGYPSQGYPPQGYPPQQGYGYPPPQQYAQQPPQRQEVGFLEGCLAALCCCCMLDACF